MLVCSCSNILVCESSVLGTIGEEGDVCLNEEKSS